MKVSTFLMLIWSNEICLAFHFGWLIPDSKKEEYNLLYHPQACTHSVWSIQWHKPKNPWALPARHDAPRGRWLNPEDVQLIAYPAIPHQLIIPDPMLPTDNLTILRIYHQAIEALIENDAKSEEERKTDMIEYGQNGRCWMRRNTCRNSSWPWFSCESDAQAIKMHNWLDPLSIQHDEMTLSLLTRSYRMALVDLGRKLVPIINQVGGLKKRGDDDVWIPQSAEYIPGWHAFFTDPKIIAEHKLVRIPHLPGNPTLPTPLLPPQTDDLRALYKEATYQYEEDQKQSNSHRRRLESIRQQGIHDWIFVEPCYHDPNMCNGIDNYTKRILDTTWIPGHEETRANLIKKAERLGFVALGEKLIAEQRASQALSHGDLDWD